MKHIVALFTVVLVLSFALAYAHSATSGEIVLTATVSPTDTSNTGNTFEVGDARFISHSIIVESAAVAVADFNNDSHLDLVSAGEPQLTIFRGDGDGGFINTSRVPGGENPVDFALADLDEDGHVDLVVANHDTDYLTILLGNGQGDFQPAPNSPLRIDVQPHPHAVRLADLDSDGHVDLIVDHRDGEGLLILRGLGHGEFDLPGTLVYGGGDPYRGMAVGDVNGDGKLDLVTPNPDDVGVLINVSQEQIAFAPVSRVPADAPFAVELGDFNGDGRLDLIAASDEGSPLVELFWGDGIGGFKEAADSPLKFASGGKKIAVGDFNGDGIADAAVASYQSSDVLVLLGGRDSIQTGYLPGEKHPWDLAVADWNEDGQDDLVIGDDVTQRATVYLSIAP